MTQQIDTPLRPYNAQYEMVKRIDHSLEYIRLLGAYEALLKYRESVINDLTFGQTVDYRNRFLEEIEIKLEDARDKLDLYRSTSHPVVPSYKSG
jgi:hypothetical protein